MTRKQQRLYAIILVLTGVVIAAALTLTALRSTVSFFYTPSDITGPAAKHIDPDRPFRLGGMVVFGSVEKHGTLVKFTITDYAQDVSVEYTGIVPGLFREGKGVVAIGKMGADHVFIADQLLAKHDENYTPPDMTKALNKIRQQKAAAAP